MLGSRKEFLKINKENVRTPQHFHTAADSFRVSDPLTHQQTTKPKFLPQPNHRPFSYRWLTAQRWAITSKNTSETGERQSVTSGKLTSWWTAPSHRSRAVSRPRTAGSRSPPPRASWTPCLKKTKGGRTVDQKRITCHPRRRRPPHENDAREALPRTADPTADLWAFCFAEAGVSGSGRGLRHASAGGISADDSPAATD